MKSLVSFLSALLLTSLVCAQSVPNGGTITQGQVWTAPQWTSAWQSKADAVNGVLNSPTIVGGNGSFNAISSQSLSLSNLTLSPPNNVPNGSVGFGAEFNLTTRIGGYGQYGNVLDEYLVTAATPGGQFDTGLTSWATHTNLTGGQIFGAWLGANTPSFYLGESFPASGGAAVGAEINAGNRWADFGLQADVGGPRYTVGLQLVPDVVTSTDTSQTVITINAGSPCIVSWAANALPLNTPVTFGGTGTLPAALVAGTPYYVTVPATDTFEVSATVNGSAINCATASAGSITGIPSFPGSFGEVLGASLHAHKWWVGRLNRFDTIMPLGHANSINGGSASNGNVPQDAMNLGGFWVNGIDLSSAAFSGTAIKTPSISITSGGATYPVPKMSWGAITGGASTCSISGAQGSSNFASCTGTTGVYVITFTASYASAPVCTGSNDINSAGAYSVNITTSVTQAQVNLGLSGSASTGTINVTCMGL